MTCRDHSTTLCGSFAAQLRHLLREQHLDWRSVRHVALLGKYVEVAYKLTRQAQDDRLRGTLRIWIESKGYTFPRPLYEIGTIVGQPKIGDLTFALCLSPFHASAPICADCLHRTRNL